ncbi:efflux RND transporter periplasmic adaptor subunit [Carnimonas bestiolae]|uniref:efflux RND transporter periplasmic adaptor subunit n=1 Tax=Carnimonas bestiolae TaxID=3402172 RepID=UPI003EDBE622
MSHITKSRSVFWGLAGAVALAMSGCGQSSDQQQSEQQAPAKQAQVYKIAARNIQLDKSYPASVRSDNAADVTARVEGVLESQTYKAGTIVKKGDPLFTIEPDTYAAKVAQAKAALVSAQSDAQNAARDNRRYQELFRRGAISASQRDAYSNSASTSQAAVERARAALHDAQIDLNYSTVRATAAGQVGLNEVNVGQLVSSGTKLTTVTPINPLEVRFQIPEEDAMQIRRQQSMTGAPEILTKLGVGSEGELNGHLDYIGASVNSDTNTVQARASFDNPKGIYLPGQYAQVKLQKLMRFNVYAVPEIAVTQGLMGPQVFVLDGDNKVTTRQVELGDIAGSDQIVTKGLKRDDRVIASDPGAINAGDKIDPQPFRPDADAQGSSSNNDGQPSDGE